MLHACGKCRMLPHGGEVAGVDNPKVVNIELLKNWLKLLGGFHVSIKIAIDMNHIVLRCCLGKFHVKLFLAEISKTTVASTSRRNTLFAH